MKMVTRVLVLLGLCIVGCGIAANSSWLNAEARNALGLAALIGVVLLVLFVALLPPGTPRQHGGHRPKADKPFDPDTAVPPTSGSGVRPPAPPQPPRMPDPPHWGYYTSHTVTLDGETKNYEDLTDEERAAVDATQQAVGEAMDSAQDAMTAAGEAMRHAGEAMRAAGRRTRKARKGNGDETDPGDD